MGELTRASTSIKPARHAKPAIRLPKIRGCLQPRRVDSIIPYTTPPSPRVTTNAPSQSTRRVVVSRLAGIRRSEMAITMAATGTLMKNAQRQEACSISHPPRTGPKAVVIAVKPDHVPIARPRSFSSNDALKIDNCQAQETPHRILGLPSPALIRECWGRD